MDERQKVLSAKKQGRGNKRLQVHDTQYWNHPSLDYGTFGGATLMSSNGRLAWTTVVDTSSGELEPRTYVWLIPLLTYPQLEE